MPDITPHEDSPSAGGVNPLDAYQPPPLPDITPAAGSKSGFGRVNAICAIAIVLGVGGVAASLMGAVGLLVGEQVQAAFSGANQPGVPQPIQDLQRETQQRIQAVQDRFSGVSLVLVVAHLVVALLLFIGGIQTLRRVSPGRKILVAACLAAIAFELIRGAVQTVIQVQVLSVTTQILERMMDVSMDQAVERLVWFSRLAMVAGVLFAIGWILVKLVFYGVAVWYLRKPAVREYLDTAGAS